MVTFVSLIDMFSYLSLVFLPYFVSPYSNYPLKLFSPVVAIANGLFSKTVNPTPRPPSAAAATASSASTTAAGAAAAGLLPAAPPPSARHSVSQLPIGFQPQIGGAGGARLPQTVHGVDMSSFLSAAAATAAHASARRSHGRGSPAPSSSTTSSSHRSSPAPSGTMTSASSASRATAGRR